MAGVETLEHIDGLSASDFPYNNPARTHSQGRPDQITDGDLPAALSIWPACFQPHEVPDALDLKLCIVLDRNDPFIFRDEVGERV